MMPFFNLPVQEYMTNIQVIDKIVRETEQLLSDFYRDPAVPASFLVLTTECQPLEITATEVSDIVFKLRIFNH